jgi:hypothetical protein
MTASQFWELQQFSYIETYSFNRDPKRTALIQQTRESLQTARYMQQPAMRQLLNRLESGVDTLTQGLGDFHPTATGVATVSQNSALGEQLAVIFRQAAKQEYYAGCRPIYRDALAFYDAQGQLLRVLNICFECHYMKTDAGLHIEASELTYDALRDYLTQLGHPIALPAQRAC